MRALLAIFTWGALTCGCTTDNACKPGSALLQLTLPPGVDHLEVSVSVDGMGQKTFPFSPTHTQESIEIDFAKGYPQNATLSVSITASANNVEVGTVSGSITLTGNCVVVPIAFSLGDGGVVDLAPLPDGGLPVGSPCGDGSICNGFCVDGYCCDDVCNGLCEACNLSGREGHCAAVMGAPTLGACGGDSNGPCAGTCDGTLRSDCVYAAVPCSAASCAGGVATVPKVCANGTCPTGAADQQTCRMGCLGDTCLGVLQVAAARTFACAVLTSQEVRCWGDNSTHGLGLGADNTMVYKTPQAVPAFSAGGAEQLAGTQTGMCARLSDGSVKCWGDGNGTPTTVAGVSGATFLGGSSGTHYCAIVAGGELRCWGYNSYGELGNGTSGAGIVPSPQPVCAPGSTMLPCTNATGATWVWSGDDFTCAVFQGGAVACWGHNQAGQLGFLPMDDVPHPFPVTVAGLSANTITAGNATVCATSLGEARCWGIGGDRLGTGPTAMSTATPTAVCTASDCSTKLSSVFRVSTFDESVCAAAGGVVRCWGSNSTDQLGDGSSSTAKASQSYAGSIAVAKGAEDVVAGGQSNYAIIVDRAERYLVAWGSDFSGELGDNSATGNPSPAPVEPKW